MRSTRIRTAVACTVAVAALFAVVVHAAISLSTSAPATQDFDGMGIPATATTPSALPADFRADNPSTVRTVGSFAVAGSTTPRAGGASLSSSAANGIYSFGAGTTALGSTDRAVGFVSSGTATASGNLYAQYTNSTGGDLSGLKISYDVEKYRLGINPAGFCVQLYYSSDGTAWTSAGSNFLTAFAQDPGTVNSGYATAPGDVKAIVNQTLAIAIPNSSNIFLAWNYSVCSGTTTTNAQALAIDNVSVLGIVNGAATPPSGTMTVSPSSLKEGDQFTATVTVTPGTNAIASVIGDFSAIGINGPQSFVNTGTNIYTATGIVPSGATGGNQTLKATISDTSTPALTFVSSATATIVTHTPPTGTGSANPGTVAPAAQTTITVNVTPGANPTSTGITVTGDLSAIGINGPQTFMNAGTNSFSYLATVTASTTDGGKTFPITVADDLGASSTFNVSLNVATPFVQPSVKISQVYGGGGNSGATFLNDFVELFNSGTTAVDVTTWSVQEASATSSTWNVAPLCPVGSCTIQPGHYFLVWESAGTGTSVKVPLPAADAAGTALVSATSAKFALMANTTPLNAACPAGQVVDFVGYGGANCSETQAAPGLSNTTADIRIGNGCTDTDNNSADFVSVTPLPRNGSSPPHVCGDSSMLRALGLASPTGPERGGLVTLMVQLTPATSGPVSGFSVRADLSSIGGDPSQSFMDDGTNGDAVGSDNTFSYQLRTPFTLSKGVHTVVATVTDGTTTLNEPISFTAALPTCGTERWAVKVGDDLGAANVDLVNPATPTTIQALVAASAPTLNPNPPYDPRFSGVETTRWVLNATMMAFKKETDVDYHIVIADTSGTMIAEIPEPDCASDASPFRPGILKARQTFDGQFTATPDFQNVTFPVRITGVGFFDFLHGQTGVAPNGVEVHPVLDVIFQSRTATAVASSANPSKYQDDVAFTATVSSPGSAPGGQITFFDGGTPLGTLSLDSTGRATIHTSTLAVGPHSITARYLGDDNTTPSSSAPLTQSVGQAGQTIAFDPIPDKTFGDADFSIAVSSSSGLGVTLTKISGPATLSGATVHITGAGSVTIRATQDGDGNYTAAAPVDRTFSIAKASQTISFNGPVPTPLYGALPFDVTASGGASGNPVTFTGNGACAAQGQNGIATVTIVSGGECHVIASQAGNGNYASAPDATETIIVGRATADIHVKPVAVTYDGQPHGLNGTAVGVNAEDLGGLLNLGATFTNVPGGTATWAFAGNTNYLPASGQEPVTITRATPAFSNLSSASIEAGTPQTTIGGTLSLGVLVPTGSVNITLAGTTMAATVAPDGRFAATFTTGALPASATPYGITFAYGGDGNFNAITAPGSLRVGDTTPPAISGAAARPDTLGPPNHKMIDVTVAYQASPDLSGAPSCGLSVTSNEPVNGAADGNTATDWRVIDPHHVQLRAERADTGNGRVYTIAIRCTDAAGNTASTSATVSVPK